VASVNPLVAIVGLAGGLAVFLLGLDTLTDSLRSQSGAGLRRLMARLTRNRFTGLLTGVLATVLLQSSSVTTVLAVGLVTAGIMTFPQSLAIVLGANVGTTVTAQIIAFDITTLGLAMLAGGYLATVLKRSERSRLLGSVFLGLGLVFLGMQVMGQAMRPLRDLPAFVEAMEQLANPVLGVLVGAAFTALVQSSTAATALAIALAGQGLIALEAGVALIIGANIGTCVTAGVAAIGKPPEAVRVAVAHVMINLAGAAAWLVLLRVLVDWSVAVSPSYPELAGAQRLAAETPRQLAMAHTLFNVSTAMVLVWFVGPLCRLIERIVPDRREPAEPEVAARLDDSLLAAPAAALEATREQTGEFSALVVSMCRSGVPAVVSGPAPVVDGLVAGERQADRQYRAIVGYLSDLTAGGGIEPDVARSVSALLETADELEAVADTVGVSLVALARKRAERGIPLAPAVRSLLSAASGAVVDHLAESCVHVVEPVAEDGDRVRVLAGRAEQVLTEATEQLRQRTAAGQVDVLQYALATDVLAQYRRILDSGWRIARAGMRSRGEHVPA
jgi:phosphate:Na+ symporter